MLLLPNKHDIIIIGFEIRGNLSRKSDAYGKVVLKSYNVVEQTFCSQVEVCKI